VLSANDPSVGYERLRASDQQQVKCPFRVESASFLGALFIPGLKTGDDDYGQAGKVMTPKKYDRAVLARS